VYYAALLTLFRVLALYAVGVYRSLWRYASLEHVLAVTLGITVGSAAFYFTLPATGSGYYPLTVLVIDWLVCMTLLGGSRAAFKLAINFRVRSPVSPKRVLVVGAGDAGARVVAEMKRQRDGYLPVGFVDDDPDKIGRVIQGVPVVGASVDIPRIVAEPHIDEILVTCPSAPAARLREIVSLARGIAAGVRMLPTLQERYQRIP